MYMFANHIEHEEQRDMLLILCKEFPNLYEDIFVERRLLVIKLIIDQQQNSADDEEAYQAC